MDDLFDLDEPVPVESQTFSKPTLSWSRINMLSRCGQQYYFRYVLGQRKPPSIAMVVGSGVHKSAELNLREKFEKGTLLPEEQVVEIAREKVKNDVRDNGLDAPYAQVGNATEEAKDRAGTLALLHHKAIAPLVEPLLIEHQFRLVTEGFPFDINGVIDLQEQPTMQRPVGTIRDLKTSGALKQNMAEYSDQLTLYALWSKRVYGAIAPLQLDILVSTKNPKAVSQNTTRNDKDLGVMQRRIEAAANAIEKGVFLPAPQDSWACSEKYCGWAASGDCPYFRGIRAIAVDGLA